MDHFVCYFNSTYVGRNIPIIPYIVLFMCKHYITSFVQYIQITMSYNNIEWGQFTPELTYGEITYFIDEQVVWLINEPLSNIVAVQNNLSTIFIL